MSIRFACEQCGHVFHVDEHAGGRQGRCRKCGHHVVVPLADEPADGGLRLAPLEDGLPERSPAHLLNTPPPLNLRPGEAKQTAWPSAVSAEAADDLLHNRGRPNYPVDRPFDGKSSRGASGPPPWWWNFPSLTARLIARWLRKTRDVLYYFSLASLVLILYGFLFKVKMLLHIGAVIIVGSNISLFWVGLSYLLTLPFKDSLRHGLACVLMPPYAIYYWATRWHRMRPAVLNTLAAFIPMLLVALAYFFYQEAPTIEKEIEQIAPKIEAKADEVLREVENAGK
jgi:DNA-directed RNA polymerase subunit RPC12/RpoP